MAVKAVHLNMGIEGKNPLQTINLNIFSDENLKLNFRSPSYSTRVIKQSHVKTMFSVKTQEKSELQVENEPTALCEVVGCSNH